MPALAYLIPRFFRRILPETGARFLLSRAWVIRPGLETSAPLEAGQRWLNPSSNYNRYRTGDDESDSVTLIRITAVK